MHPEGGSMNFPQISLPKYKLAIQIATLCAAVLALSWVANQCRQWGPAPAPKPYPSVVDAGTPIAGPSSSAPTVTVGPRIAVPALSLDELKAEAEKYGMQLVLPATAGKKTPKAGPTTPGAAEAPTEAPKKEFDIVWPMFLGAESFKHAPSGADVDVAAWLPGEGQRVDLRASWREWTPPPIPPAAKQVVCQSGSFFANEAKWYGAVGGGIVANSQGAGLGPTADLGYLGPRTGKITWGAGTHAAYSSQSGFQGDAVFRMSW